MFLTSLPWSVKLYLPDFLVSICCSGYRCRARKKPWPFELYTFLPPIHHSYYDVPFSPQWGDFGGISEGGQNILDVMMALCIHKTNLYLAAHSDKHQIYLFVLELPGTFSFKVKVSLDGRLYGALRVDRH